jgi:hypothetical protein
MKKITQKLDDILLTRLPNDGIKFYGLAELVSKENSRYPVTVNDRGKVAIDDKWDAVFYHRVISNNPSLSEEFSFGLRTATMNQVTLRTVVAYKINKGEEWRYTFANAYPQMMQLTGYEYIQFSPTAFNEDHESVMNEEFVEVKYHDHRLPWNVFSFDNIVEFVKCHDFQNIQG